MSEEDDADCAFSMRKGVKNAEYWRIPPQPCKESIKTKIIVNNQNHSFC
jgi:hypothetical protein